MKNAIAPVVAGLLAAVALSSGCRATPEHPPRFAVAPAPAAVPPPAIPEAAVPPFLFEDLAGQPVAITFPRERPLILTLADYNGVGAMEEWARVLADKLPPEVEIQGVALLAGATPAMRPMVRGFLKRKFTRNPLLDWGGSSSNRLSFTAGQPNLHLLDKNGRVVHTAVGNPGEAAVEALLAAARAAGR